MELPNGQNAKISNVADDTTLILVKTRALEMRIVNSFKACPNKTKPLDLSVRKTPSNLWNILSPQDAGVKYNIKVNFLHYYQLISALPTHVKSEASAYTDLGNLNVVGVRLDFHLAKDLTLN